jgi:hypothetical protein
MNLRRILLAAASALSVFAFGEGVCLTQEAASGDIDDRTVVTVTPAERNYILNQMRLFVISVQTIAAGFGAEDRAQASTAASARRLKRNANDPDFPPTLGTKLPPQWKQLGGGARKGFDVLAETIGAGAGTQKYLEQLGIVMTNCVACHATYRVETSKD